MSNLKFIYDSVSLPERKTLDQGLSELPKELRKIMDDYINENEYDLNPITRKPFVNYKRQYLYRLYNFINNNEIDLFEQIIPYMIGCFDLTTLHFLLLKMNEIFYKKRENPYYYKMAIDICKMDVIVIDKLKIENWYCPTVNRLLHILEKEKKYHEASQICLFAINHKLPTNTKKRF